MKINSNLRNTFPPFITLLTALFTVVSLNAQVVRGYTLVYSDNLKGGHTMFGNTILARGATQMNEFIASPFGSNSITSTSGNDGATMNYVDVDGDALTFNSSTADLVLPVGTNTIKFARLYWGGRIGTGNANYATRRNVKLRKGTSGAYLALTAPLTQLDESLISGSEYAYQAYIDITAYVNSNGAGTYSVASVAATTGSTNGGGYFAGWSIVVVYENLTQPYSSVRAYDGYLQVYNGGASTTQSITLTGLNAPSTPIIASDAYMSTMAWEGDANLAASSSSPNGDYIKVNTVAVSNPVNPVKNFWNGTISKNGVHISTKNPNYLNQMGIDIDEQQIGVGYGILSNANTVNIEFGTEADQYFPSVFAFTMKAKDPLVILDKTATTDIVPYLLLNPNENIIYTISGINNGTGNALNCVVVDTIPQSVTYVANSMKINVSPGGFTGPKTDINDGVDQAFKAVFGGKTYLKFFIGTGATGTSGGVLAPGESYSLEFKCLTPLNATSINSVSNTARITGNAISGDPFVDDGTVLIGPPGSPLSVKMTVFSVKKTGNDALLTWVTESETKNDHFDIERSIDGINYTSLGRVAGNGTTSDTKNYQYADPINSSAKIIYYRLRIVDLDGKITYSKLIALRMDGLVSLNNFTTYPNPFISDVKLQMSSTRELPAIIRINNMAGQQQTLRNVTLQNGENIILIKDLGNLNSGMYVMEIITEEGRIVQKITKQ